MIRAVIFDLDGTLVRTERLKALSYGRAADELDPSIDHEESALLAFGEVVGQSRRNVAIHVMKALGVETLAAARCAEFGVDEPWRAFVQIRLGIYTKMTANVDLLCENRWLHNVELVATARSLGCRIGLATASSCAAAQHVLGAIGLADAFDFVATDDDVEHNKPDPEIDLLVACELGVSPAQCIVIEDSPSGVRAALAAGMRCIAVGSDFTRERLHAEGLLGEEWIVDDPALLEETLRRAFAAAELDDAQRADTDGA
jgi:beta-phosphoglucomutase-like phosphatase (HAD superfamily)